MVVSVRLKRCYIFLCSCHIAQLGALPSIGQQRLDDEVSLIHTAVSIDSNRNLTEILNWAQESAQSAEEIAKQVDNVANASIHKAANATVSVIHMVALAVQETLSHVNDQAEALHNQMKQADEGFLKMLRSEPNSSVLKVFETNGGQTIKAFMTLGKNLETALEMSGTSIGKVLKVAGFLHLANEVDKNIEACITPLNKSLENMAIVQTDIQNISSMVNLTAADKISPKLGVKLETIRSTVANAMIYLNSSFEEGLNETFLMVRNHLMATVQEVLPREFVRKVESDLRTTEPDVRETEAHAKQVSLVVYNTFNSAIKLVREKMDIPHQSHARGAAVPGITMLAIATVAAMSSWS